jgi:protein-S-isoprenylcysteine O-methyltransferase Ste14
MPARAGWILMELPAPISMALVYSRGENALQALPILFLVLFQLHYFHRALVYPLLARGRNRRIALFTVVAAVLVNSLNGSLCGWAVAEVGDYGREWVRDPRFIVGIGLFVAGAAVNLQSDSILRRLRKPGETRYQIPHGGLYRWVSCPNYLGEIVEWAGFALATWSLAGLAFAVFTAANLVPRALANHRWYREHFDSYPAERRALLPFVF